MFKLWLFQKFGAQPSSILSQCPHCPYPGLSLSDLASALYSPRQPCCLPAQIRSNISLTVYQSGSPMFSEISASPPGAPAQYWEVLPSPATGARISVSEPGTLRTEDAAYQKLSIINFQYTPLGNWGVTSSSPFSSYLQPLAATKNRYIISQKRKNQERVLFDLLDPLQ